MIFEFTPAWPLDFVSGERKAVALTLKVNHVRTLGDDNNYRINDTRLELSVQLENGRSLKCKGHEGFLLAAALCQRLARVGTMADCLRVYGEGLAGINPKRPGNRSFPAKLVQQHLDRLSAKLAAVYGN